MSTPQLVVDCVGVDVYCGSEGISGRQLPPGGMGGTLRFAKSKLAFQRPKLVGSGTQEVPSDIWYSEGIRRANAGRHNSPATERRPSPFSVCVRSLAFFVGMASHPATRMQAKGPLSAF